MWILVSSSHVPIPLIQGWVMFASVFCFVATTVLAFLYVIGAHGNRTSWITLVSPVHVWGRGSDGRSPPGGGLSQCWVRSPVGVSRPPSKAERPTAAQGSRGRRLTDTVPAWVSGGCSAFSSAITPFLETSSPTSLPVPPAPARGRSASPTTQQDWLSPPGRGRGAGGGSHCPV